MGTRIAPTPEDQEIFKRNFARVVRQCGESGVKGMQTLKVLRNATADYLHFSASEKR